MSLHTSVLGFNNTPSKMQKCRQNHRFADIQESERLLLELSISEPTIQQCFRIMESTCLSQGIYCKIDGKVASQEFLDHLDQFYTGFCRAALRAMCVYGFVPWRVRKLPSGDFVPEVLPAGTFSWFTELNYSKKESFSASDGQPNKRKHADLHDFDSAMVIYRLIPTSGVFKEEDVDIYVFIVPSLDIMNNSMLYATVPSPLAHLLTDYKALRQGQIRRSHADAWNTTAKVITEFDPKLRVEDNPTQYLMDFVHEDFYQPPSGAQAMYPPFEAHNVWQREQVIRRQFEENPSVHYPEVFALPRDHRLAQQQKLEPCEDIQFLNEKYKRDVCSILGIPYEMVQGNDSKKAGPDSTKKTMASGRIFSTNMQDYCKHLQRLLKMVYEKIYRQSNVVFSLVPMPRLEVESIADLKVLHEIGALTPDMSMQVSKTLLGENNFVKNKTIMSSQTAGESAFSKGGKSSKDDQDKQAKHDKQDKPDKKDDDKKPSKSKP